MANPPSRQSDKKITVRLAKAADVSQVIAIDSENTGLAKDEYWQDLFERYNSRAGDDDGESGVRTADRQRFFLVACEGDHVLGFVIGEVRAWEFGSPPCGWVFAIGVRGNIRQESVGSTLFDALCDRFRRVGVGKVRTMLARDHTVIMSFFRSHGMMAGPFVELEKDL